MGVGRRRELREHNYSCCMDTKLCDALFIPAMVYTMPGTAFTSARTHPRAVENVHIV